jgi:acetyltransferase-like isoleucine patch superfamily enzyme
VNAPATLLCGSDDEIPRVDPTAFIHHKAHVQDSSIGARTKVWQFASITRGTVLGEDCNIAPFAVLDGAKFGNGCIISMHVAMGPGFEVGDRVFIGPSVVFCNDGWPTVSKEGFDADKLRNGFVTIRVGDDAGIGAGAVILPGVTIGKGAFVAAGAVCDRSIPEYHLFTRTGVIRPLPDNRRRMRAAC